MTTLDDEVRAETLAEIAALGVTCTLTPSADADDYTPATGGVVASPTPLTALPISPEAPVDLGMIDGETVVEGDVFFMLPGASITGDHPEPGWLLTKEAPAELDKFRLVKLARFKAGNKVAAYQLFARGVPLT